jgi:type VI secretion system protein ImpK
VREEVARVVYEVLRDGLKLREQLDLGSKSLSLEGFQLQLKNRLHSPAIARDPAAEGDGYLGARYALVSWLDEIFILGDSPWKDDWNRKALEVQLFGDRLRAPMFWQQADLASVRSDKDALETFLLCLLLGFRGDLRDDVGSLQDRREKFEAQIGKRHLGKWPEEPPALAVPPTNVPELHGRDRLRRLLLVLGLALGLAAFVVVFFTLSS